MLLLLTFELIFSFIVLWAGRVNKMPWYHPVFQEAVCPLAYANV
jgi:hypothetical protein